MTSPTGRAGPAPASAVSELQEQPDALADLLERRAGDWAGWALFPTNDEALAALSEHGESLSSRYRLVAPPLESIGHLLDKQSMAEAARAVGVDTPTSYGPAELETLARDDLHFPVVVKPLATPRFFARFGSKLGIANDRGELRAWIDAMHRVQIPGVVLDLVPGPDSDIYAYCAYLDRAAGWSPGGWFGSCVRALRGSATPGLRRWSRTTLRFRRRRWRSRGGSGCEGW